MTQVNAWLCRFETESHGCATCESESHGRATCESELIGHVRLESEFQVSTTTLRETAGSDSIATYGRLRKT